MVRENNPDFHLIKENQNDVYPKHVTFPVGEVGFTSGVDETGQAKTIKIDDVDCYAKVEYIPTEDGGPLTFYYIKVGIRGFLFNPWGLFSEGTQAKEAKHLGRSAWEFKKVSKECFERYLQFLTTRNRAYLNIAEREVRNNA